MSRLTIASTCQKLTYAEKTSSQMDNALKFENYENKYKRKYNTIPRCRFVVLILWKCFQRHSSIKQLLQALIHSTSHSSFPLACVWQAFCAFVFPFSYFLDSTIYKLDVHLTTLCQSCPMPGWKKTNSLKCISMVRCYWTIIQPTSTVVKFINVDETTKHLLCHSSKHLDKTDKF